MTRQEATTAAKIVQRRLGKDWKIRIWENMGWCWRVTRGPVSVHGASDDSARYWCMISSDVNDASYGAGIWGSPVKYFKDPRNAVRAKFKTARAVVSSLRDVVDCVHYIVKEWSP